MCKRLVVFVVIVSVSLAGCTSVAPESYVFDPTIVIDADSEAVWDAVANFFEASQLPIETIARDSGLIVTGTIRCSTPSHGSGEEARCYCEAGATEYARGRCTVLVRPAAGGTELRAFYACSVMREHQYVFGYTDRYLARGRSTGYFEHLLLSYVVATLEGTALPDVSGLRPAGGTAIPDQGRRRDAATATVDADYDEVWHAVVEFFVISGLPIDVCEWESGLLATSWMDPWVSSWNPSERVPGADFERYCDFETRRCLLGYVWMRGKFTVSVERLAEGRSEIKVSSLYQGMCEAGEPPAACTSTGQLEALVHAYVRARVSDEQPPQVPRLCTWIAN